MNKHCSDNDPGCILERGGLTSVGIGLVCFGRFFLSIANSNGPPKKNGMLVIQSLSDGLFLKESLLLARLYQVIIVHKVSKFKP